MTPESLQRPLALLEQRFPQTVVPLPAEGGQVAVRQCGVRSHAPSIVLLHGISSGAASWLSSALVLSEQAHVLAWDAPGYGDSTPLATGTPRADDYAARLDALLQACGIASCVLVGHSLGALMGAAYATSQAGRTRVQRLVLISPAGGYGTDALAATRERIRSERKGALLSLGVDGIAQRIAQRLLSDQASKAAIHWVQWNTARLRPGGYAQAVDMLCDSDLGRYTALPMPVRVHCGDADVVTPPDACAVWAKVLNAPFSLIAQAGHASPVEQPVAVAQLIAQAFKEVSPHV